MLKEVKIMNCNGECSSCKSTCSITCPKCKAPGMEVPSITVASLCDSTINLDETHYLCLRPNCDVVYFDENGKTYEKDKVNVPVWFKSKYDEYMVCYCREIYLKDVVRAVFELGGCENKKEILTHLGKGESKGMCIVKNPTGKPCDELFVNAIAYANKIYKKHQEEK